EHERDLHFQTKTTIDTLDYSGTGLNSGSKLAVAAAGPQRRRLCRELPSNVEFPRPFGGARLAFPGVAVLDAPPFTTQDQAAEEVAVLERGLGAADLSGLPLLVLADDAAFAAATIDNFVWVSFTRSNPSHDVHGIGSFVEHK